MVEREDDLLDAMGFLNDVAERYPTAVSLASGRPWRPMADPAEAETAAMVFIRHWAANTGRTVTEAVRVLSQYGPTAGVLGDLLCRFLTNDFGIQTEPSSIVVTNGAQEAMLVALLGLASGPRDAVLVPDPCYVGFLGAARVARVPMVPVATTHEGVTVDTVSEALARAKAEGLRARLLYVVPDFDNPLGSVMPEAARRDLLRLAENHDFDVVEDSPYRAFAYGEPPPPPMAALPGADRVVHIGTFSKSIAPAMRIGFLVSRRHAGRFARIKSYVSVNTSGLLQAMVGGVLLQNDLSLAEHVRPRLELYRRNRDALVGAFDRAVRRDPELAGNVELRVPEGGFFASATVPFDFRRAEVDRLARDHGVIVCPMSLFSLTGSRRGEIRLAFSTVSTEAVGAAVGRLVEFCGSTWRGRRR